MVNVVSKATERGVKYSLEGVLPPKMNNALVKINAENAQNIINAIRKGNGKVVTIKRGLKVDSPNKGDSCVIFVFTGKVGGNCCESCSDIIKQLKKVK